MEKSQSPAHQQQQQVPLQISPEQLQQLQQLQMQHGGHFAAIQVKQEFPAHASTGHNAGSQGEIKHAGTTTTTILDPAQAAQLQQQMQMHLADAAAAAGNQGAVNSPATSQHSTALSTMSPMQLATTGCGPNDWSQARTAAVQLMQPSTALNSGFLYHPSMLVSGNLIHSGGLGQQPIQVITASKPFQNATSQMLAAAAAQNTKQLIATGANTSFTTNGGGTYTAIPSSQAAQALLFSPVNVISQTTQQQHQQQHQQVQQQQQQQQQQNILQSMAAVAAAAQQQQQQTINKIQQVDGQNKLVQQKLVQQKVTTTTNTNNNNANVAQQQHQQHVVQQQQNHAIQPQLISNTLQSTTTNSATQQMHTISAPSSWLQGVPVPFSMPWPTNGLQQLTPNQIIIRGTPQTADQSMFIQQQQAATNAHQTIQAQPTNQITLQCNVTQTHNSNNKTLATKAQQQVQHQQQASLQQAGQIQNMQQQQQQTIVTTQLQQQQRNATQILPHTAAGSGQTQIRPASSVSTQTAQNQLLKHKMRNKQHAVRPALPVLKADNATLQQVVKNQQQQQQQLQQLQPQQQTMHQLVASAGNKYVKIMYFKSLERQFAILNTIQSG